MFADNNNIMFINYIKNKIVIQIGKYCNSKSLNLLARYRYNEDDNNAIVFNHIDHQIVIDVFGQTQGAIIE